MSAKRRAEAPPAVRWTAYVAVAIVFAIACVILANWQFSRNAERSVQLALVERNYDTPPVPLGDVLAPGAELRADDEWTPVTLTGRYLADDQLLARNRPHGGTAAFEVLVPFLLDDGRVLLVDRGWVPPGEQQADPDDVPSPPGGDATVVVRLRPSEPEPSSGRSAPAGQVPTISLPLVAELLPDLNVEPGAYGLMVTEDPEPATQPQPLASPSEDPGPHLSYAIQWILFAIMGFIFIWYVIRTELRHREEDREDRDAGVTGPRAVAASAPARRRDRDAVEEDALLDAHER